jgi:hypothetical protein
MAEEAQPTIGRCPRGHSHYRIQQNRISDCGPSCISIILHTLGHAQKNTPIADIRQMSAKYPGHYRPARNDIRMGPAMANGSPLAALASLAYDAVRGYRDSEHYDGTYSGNLAEVLKNDFGYNNARCDDYGTGRGVKDVLKRGRPVIVLINWVGGGGHFIVGGLGRDWHIVGNSEYCFSDPYYGLVSQPINDAARTEYRARAQSVAHFSGWVVTL